MSRVLVTGATSFSARFLLPRLRERADVESLATTDMQPHGPEGTDYVPAQIQDPRALRAVVGAARPDVVFHLAGVVTPEPATAFAVNLDGARHLLDACAAHSAATRVLLVSSAAVYGATHADETPVGESTPLRPVSAYGVSKAAAEMYALSLHRRGEVRAAIVRPFNLVGEGLRLGMAPSDFVAQARAIREGRSAPEVRVGNLDPRRDFLDVHDAVDAYVRLAFHDDTWGGTFNVATGIPVSVGDLLATILRLAGVEATIVVDAERRRPVDVLEQVGDATRLTALTGWQPQTPLAESLRRMLDASV